MLVPFTSAWIHFQTLNSGNICRSFVSLTENIVVSTSCSLLHTAVDLVNETKLDDEIKSWLAFAAQKVVEVNALAKALSGHKDEVLYLSAFELAMGT